MHPSWNWLVGSAIVGAGCLVQNPAYDLPGASGGATSASGTGGPGSTGGTGSAGAPTTGTGSATTGGGATATASTGATTTDPTGTAASSGGTSSTGAPPICGDEGEPCVSGACCGECLACDGNSGLCVADDMACGTCHKCQAGACVEAPGGACELPPGEGCEHFIYGPGQPGCLAYAPAPGVCDAALNCNRLCNDPGDAIGPCDLACADNSLCGKDLPVVEFDSANYCTINGKTPTCTDTCVNSAEGSMIKHFGCNFGGNCVPTPPDTGCGAYVCDGVSETCLTSCESAVDCVLAACVNSMCM